MAKDQWDQFKDATSDDWSQFKNANPRQDRGSQTRQQATAGDDNSWTGYAKTLLGNTARDVVDVGKGLASIPDMVVKPVNTLTLAAYNAITGQNAKYADDSNGTLGGLIEKGAGAANIPKPQGRLGNLISSGIQSAAPAVLTGGESALATAGQALIGGASGVAGEATKQAGYGPLAQIAAALGVGIAPAAGVSALKNIAGEVGSFTNLSKYLPEWMAGGADAGARERAAKALQDASQNPQAAADAVWNRPAPSPGTQPTLGETAGDERLAAFQRLHTDSESGILPNQVTNAQARNQTVKDVIGGTDAQTVQDLAARQSAANEATLAARKAQGQNALDTLQAQHEAAVAAQQQAGVSAVQGVTDSGNAALDAATQAVGSPLSREESSVWSRAKYKANLLAATLKTRAAYRAPELTNPTPIPVDADQAKSIFGDLTAKADAFYGDAGGDAPGKVQSAVHDILDAIGGDNLNTKSVANVDRRLADFASTKRVAGATKEAAFAESLRGTLSDHLDPFIPQETKDALATASAARAEQAQIFEQGRIGALFRPKKFGEDRVSDSELAGRLVTTGDAGGTLGLQLKNALGPDAAEQLVSEHMRRMADLGKLNTSSGFNAYDALLSHFPDVQARIQAMRAQAATNVTDIAGQRAANVSNVADLVAANKRNFAQQRDAISANTDAQAASNRAFNASPLGGLRDPTQVDPSVAIGQMLSSPHGGPQMETLVNQLKDSPTAMDGARKALADHVDRLATKGANFDSNGLPIPKVNPSIAALDDVLKNHAGLLNDDQVQALTGVQNELKAANFANTGGKILPKPITDKTIPANAIVARTIRFLTARFNNEDRVNELIRAAIVDPEVGKNMLLRSTPDRLGNVMRRVRSATAAAAVGTAVQQYPGLTGTVTDTSPAQPAQ